VTGAEPPRPWEGWAASLLSINNAATDQMLSDLSQVASSHSGTVVINRATLAAVLTRLADAETPTGPPEDVGEWAHLIQYTDPVTDTRRSVVVCRTHERELLSRLGRIGVGSGGCLAGSLSSCDFCGKLGF